MGASLRKAKSWKLNTMYKVNNNLVPDYLKHMSLLGEEIQNIIHVIERTIPFPNPDLNLIDSRLFLTL